MTKNEKGVFMDIHESGEMYLETILVLQEQGKDVRVTDIANERNYSKASVSRGLSVLCDKGLVEYDEKGKVELTEEGKKIAEEIWSRHKMLTKFIESLGVTPETAEADACRIEHVISDETAEAIKKKLA